MCVCVCVCVCFYCKRLSDPETLQSTETHYLCPPPLTPSPPVQTQLCVIHQGNVNVHFRRRVCDGAHRHTHREKHVITLSFNKKQKKSYKLSRAREFRISRGAASLRREERTEQKSLRSHGEDDGSEVVTCY
ncbi:unnamed protein product [Gadus morhua 'NCC']